MTDLPLASSGRGAPEIATAAAKQAGEILLARFHKKKEIKDKGRGDLVTEVDGLSEQVIIKLLSAEYPACHILTEESAPSTLVTGYTWVIDPLAGTNNFVFGIPLFGINIALVKGNDILLGITYDPLRGELFRAEKGNGAYLNDSPIRVSGKVSLQTSLLGFDPGHDVTSGRELLSTVIGLWPQVFGLRSMGSASIALAYLACGRIDLYLRRDIYPWDIASGLLLVKEAGGSVSDWQGKSADFWNKEIMAANDTLHREFLRQLKPV